MKWKLINAKTLEINGETFKLKKAITISQIVDCIKFRQSIVLENDDKITF